MGWIPGVSAADLGAVTQTVGTTHTTPCEVLRKTVVSDAMGGQVETWPVVSPPGLMCRVDTVANQVNEVINDWRLEVLSRVTIAFDLGTDVTEKDRIRALGRLYEVVAEIGPSTVAVEMVLACELVTS